jgi:hypothetical protein
MNSRNVKFVKKAPKNNNLIGLAGIGIVGLFFLKMKNKIAKSFGFSLLGVSAIGALSSFKNVIKSSVSRNKVVLLGGADFSNEGQYGINKEIARIVATAVQRKGIVLNYGDITVFNTPLIVHDFNSDIVKPLIATITNNFDIKTGKVILYGYSLGGNVLMNCLDELRKNKINVELLITVDAAKGFPGLLAVKTTVTDNVKLNLNLYQTHFSDIGSRGFSNKGKNVININLSDKVNAQNQQINHSNIDEYTMLFISQLIVYYLEGKYTLNSMIKSEIIEKIALYDKQR